MGFFDRGEDEEETEEVTLSVPEKDHEVNEGKLKDEAEARLTGESSSEGSSEEDDDMSGMLPGMGSGGGSGSSSSSGSSRSSSNRSTSGSSSRSSGKSSGSQSTDQNVTLEDVHKQNKQIKSILKDIRSELKDEGDMNGVL